MAQLIGVKLARFDSSPWGFRLQGGKDFGTPLVIQKVTVGSLAEKAGLQAGDALIRVNDMELFNLRHKDAQDCLVRAGNSFELSVQRGGSTWKPAVTPIGPTPVPSSNVGKVQPVTKTSLAARQAPAPAIASGHNVSARPFAPQVNGSIGSESVKSIVNKQYNSPVGMYSEETIAETLSAQAEVLAGGVLGVNFKKNEKNYNAANSEVFKMVQEIDKEPREPEPEIVAAPSAAPLPVTGLRHVSAPAPSASTTTTPHEPLPPGQNICADCERLIVGVFVRIKDKNLHVECFKCATCGTSLKNVGYYNINNKLYCDIHAKMVARQNPPASNLEPVTVPPGSRLPAGTISSALSSIRPSPLTAPSAPTPMRPLPAAAPLSPSSPQPGTLGPVPFHPTERSNVEVSKLIDENNIKNILKEIPKLAVDDLDKAEKQQTTVQTKNISQAPRIGTTHVNAPSPVQAPTGFGGPKPFASVPSPTPARPAPGGFSTMKPFSNIKVASKVVWPPTKEDLSNDIPTATSLYIPTNPVQDPINVTSSSDTLSHSTSHQQFLSNSKNQNTEYFKKESFLQGESEMILNEGNSFHNKPVLNTVSVVSSTKQETLHFETQSTKKVVLQSNSGLETEENLIKNDEQMKKYSICSQEVVSCTENKLVDAQMLISNARPASPIPPEVTDIASITSQTKNEINFNKTEIIKETPENICENLYKKCSEEKGNINLNANNQLDSLCEQSTKLVTAVNVDDIPIEKQSNELKTQEIRLSEADKSQSKGEAIFRPECQGEKFEHKVATQAVAIVDHKTEDIQTIDQEVKSQSITIEKDTHSLHEEKITEQSKLYTLPISQSVCEKPQKWQSALTSALTTAAERPFSPFDKSKSQPLYIEGNQILQTSKYSSFASVSNDQISSLPSQTIPCKPKLEIGTKGLTRSEGCVSPLDTALTIAPECPYSPFISSENQIPESVLPRLPQPKQRISLLSALTIAPEREFMPFPTATKASSLTSTDKTTFSIAQNPTDSLKQSLCSSAHTSNTANTSEIVKESEKSVNTVSGMEPEHNFPPVTDELKKMYSPNIVAGHSLEPQTPEANSATYAEYIKSCQENIKEVSTKEVSEKFEKSTSFGQQKAYSLTGIPKPATIPYYQKDIERYQIQRALSPTAICKRDSPSQSNIKHSTEQHGPQDTILKRPIPIKPPSVSLQETSVSSEFSKQNPPHHTSDSGLGRAAVIPHYQQDLERFQIQRTLSPAPHFKVPGSYSPSPLPIDSDAAVLAYKFGAPLRPSSMHQAISETGNISVTENEVKNISKTVCYSEQEHKKSLERISLQKTENMCKMETFNSKVNQENTSGIGGSATIPHYQKDIERYHILRALSPAPHFKVPCSRSPSPAPINTESLKTAHIFEGSILPKDIQHIEQENIQESLKEQMSVFGSSESHEYHLSALENQQYRHEEVALKNKFQSQSTKLTNNGSTSFEPPSGQLKTIPYPNIPFPESGNNYVTQNHKHETVKSLSETDLKLNTGSNQTQQLPEFIPKIPQLSSFSKASAPVKDPIASVKPQPNSTTIPNAGGGSGKTTASVAGSSAPRRGRGVLNQPSTRIPLCGHCNGHIRGPFITALGKIWCPEHFVCVIPQCRRQLQDIGFVEEKGDLYCEFCFEQYIAPSCDKCTKKIRGDCLNAIGKHYHPECFLCAYCGKLFGNNQFFLEDGLPYCESDWNELFTTKCFACGFPIEAGDRWVEALNNNYHSQCFNCTNCKKNLEGQSFYAKGGRPFCKAHAR